MNTVVCLMAGEVVAELPGITKEDVGPLAHSLYEAGFEVEIRQEIKAA